MTTEYRYSGPDGEGIDALPPAVGAAVGSEYCVHLLPGPSEMARACAAASSRGIPLVLLTPYFRDAELKRALPLFRAIPGDADLDVAVNDWGVLLTLRVLFPGLRLSIGRLLSGQKRCPRIELSARLSAAEKAWHRRGLFSSAPAREYLAEVYGVTGFHVDAIEAADAPRGGAEPDPCGVGELPGVPGKGAMPGAGAPATVFVHAPYAIVTVSDACPWLGGRSSSSVARCPRPCRDGCVVLREPSMGGDLIQRGKARFARTGHSPAGEPSRDPRRRSVVYDDIP